MKVYGDGGAKRGLETLLARETEENSHGGGGVVVAAIVW